jgi:Flp pilus assembly protein TadD
MRALLVTLILTTTTAAAQQLPPGTRDAEDNSRTNAANARLRSAESALEKGDYANAATLLQTLATEHPKDPQILYDLGYAQERTNNDAAASKSYESAIAASPDTPEPRIALGLLDARAGRTDKAHAELAAAAQLTTADPRLRARAYRALAQLDERTNPAQASDELLSAIKLTGESPADTALSAALADRAGDSTGAEAAYRRALEINGSNLDAALGLAHILQRTNRAPAAETVLTPFLKSHPEDPRIVSQMAAIYAVEGKPKQAIPLLLQLRSDPKLAADPAITRQLARLYALDNQNLQAEQTYKAALAADPTAAQDPQLLDDLGSILVREQKYPEAEAVLTKAVSLRDRFPTPDAFGDAAGHLAFAQSKAGHPRDALQSLKIRATVQPNSAPALFLEATAHDTLHEYRDAERAYKAFLVIAAGKFPDQEFQARHRLVALEHMK